MPTAKSTAVELTPAQLQAAVRLYALASDATRLRIMSRLDAVGEAHVTAICEMLGQSQPSISHHLQICRLAGLVGARREGKHRYYSLKAPGKKVVRLAAGLGE